ncbi:MAG: acetyl-CoA carboxylase, biotin carboxyl carrier protein [Elusimicrobia bacterium]|nr:acetyl-CoA carboxylase, biotin carboxyl carrier protein [Elusimicrobiota bacterium]
MNSGEKKSEQNAESSGQGKSSSQVPVPQKGQLKEILSWMEGTDLEYLQIEKDGKKILLKRSVHAVLRNQRVLPSETDAPKEKEAESPAQYSIRSPIVGRFYSSMGPDRPSLVVEGGSVTAGQKVAIVEAMKIKKEVFSAYTGKVTRILVRDGDPVEYGQELFIVEPNEESSE